jgi:hypothetical protein
MSKLDELCTAMSKAVKVSDTALAVGARVRISRTFKTGKTEVYEAIVRWAEDRGGFIYFGYEPVKAGSLEWDSSRGMWGCARMFRSEEMRPPYAAKVEVI